MIKLDYILACDSLLVRQRHAAKVAFQNLDRTRPGAVEMGKVRSPHHVPDPDDVAVLDRSVVAHERAQHVLMEDLARLAPRRDTTRAGPSPIALEAIIAPLEHRRRPGHVVLHRQHLELAMAVEDAGKDHCGDSV